MQKPTLEFWYEYSSPYAYLSSARIEALAKQRDVEVVWRPFLLGAVYKMLEMPTPAMRDHPFKDDYLWMDIARQAARYHIPIRRSIIFPKNGLLAARVSLIGLNEGWGEDFTKRVYRASFADDLDIGQPDVIEAILKNMALDAGEVLDFAGADENKLALRGQCQEAYDKKIFGIPTFFAGDEMFWGNDRLELALKAAVTASHQSTVT